MRADHDHLNQSSRCPNVGRVHAVTGRLGIGLTIAGIALLPMLVGGIAGIPAASATQESVNLGTAAPFAVLAGAGVTNTGPTVVWGDVGTSPNPAIVGFPPGKVNGTEHRADAVADQAQSDVTIAYDSAAARAPTETYGGPTDLGGLTLTTGVYRSPVSFAITGPVTLDAEHDPKAVFIFQASTTLVTATDSTVQLVNGAQACNVFWQVGSSATLGVGATFVGTVLALASITANTDAIVSGRLLARTAAVTLDSNEVTKPACATGDTPPPAENDDDSTTTPPPPDDDDDDSTAPPSDDDDDDDSTTTPPPSEDSTATPRPEEASTPTTAPGAITGASTTSRPATDVLSGAADRSERAAPAPTATLARTGSPIAATLLLGVIALVLGTTAIGLGRPHHG